MSRLVGLTGPVLVSGCVVAGAVALTTAPVAFAGTPQADTPCSASVAGALARLPDGALLQCSAERWVTFTANNPQSDRWVTYGPTAQLRLYGQASPSPQMMSGVWSGSPQSAAGQCEALVVNYDDLGNVLPADEEVAEPGQPLAFPVAAQLLTATLSGDCLWQKSA